MLKDVFSTIFVYCLKVLAIHAKIYGHRVGVHLNIYEKRIYRFSVFLGTPLYMPIRCLRSSRRGLATLLFGSKSRTSSKALRATSALSFARMSHPSCSTLSRILAQVPPPSGIVGLPCRVCYLACSSLLEHCTPIQQSKTV